jgi:MFS transporter, PAT family, beta-lactamase induction signal transducer AmpG
MSDSERRVHPWLFMVLIIPFGVMSGYTSVPIAYQLKQAGVSVIQVAAIVALGLLPHTWKFLWAPVTDATLDQKSWYLIGGVTTAIGIAIMGALPTTPAGLGLLSVVTFLASTATSFLGMAVESLMAHCTPENEKGRAGGWFQAGNLGGAGIGGGLGLWLAQHLPHTWMASTIVAALCFSCCLALLAIPTPARSHPGRGFTRSLADAVRDLWSVARERAGVLALILCFLPVGSGAAGGLWSAISDEWRTSANAVALVTGALAGLISAAGCIVGGWICDRMDRKTAYVAYGLLQAVCAVAMACSPHTQSMFVVWTSTYAFITGLTYAGFSAFVLEAIGKGAAATKYNVYASLSNMPIYYMTNVDGWAHDHRGSNGMLFTEAGFCVIGAAVFLAVASLLRAKPRAPIPGPSEALGSSASAASEDTIA